MPNKQLKFITVNMLSTNLKMIDVQGNKLSSLPEEVANLHSLEKLQISNNLITKLPSKIK
jgi:Leucine-rich repeat (LRR) protein